MARTSADLVSAVLGRPAPPAVEARSAEPSPAAAPSHAPDRDPEPPGPTPARPVTEKITMSMPAGCRRRYKVWCAEHGVTMSGIFHDYMEALLAGEAEPPRERGAR